MSLKKRGLGRGLDALLAGAQGAQAGVALARTEVVSERSVEAVARLPVDLIQRGRYQPRRAFDPDSLRELADSIAAQGVLQPIVVRPIEAGRYEIIAGERRWRAAQQAGLGEIPVVVRDVDEQAAVAIGLIENIQRDDLTPLEEAEALQRLLGEFGLTHQQVAEALGKSRTSVTNLLRLLDLNDDVKAHLAAGRLEMGHARALLGLRGDEQSRVARAVVDRGLSVRETERLVRRVQLAGEGGSAPPEPSPTGRPSDPDIRRLQEDLTDRLGAQVQILGGSKGRGKVVIAYNSLDELDGILAHIR
ncbi:ParB/RepB/Spo0J family partition protein [Thiococcus pfennigii]|uniref:ParB/RepB/Spo0J family partition protein n=1 Tax=Thiococcus pfennigii TaxID=1057 RepID=UPI001907C22B|nr:ParB/RepB/Spo0J family partition protein [Thiococcus pfennigii]MBK1701196.1 chromosome partitioning protein ParB [Thiococcus pfennigii]